MIATCPTREELSALTLGTLTESRSDELFGHLHHCESCLSEIQQIDPGEDSLISTLRDQAEGSAFEEEQGCRLAVTRALAALTSVDHQAADMRRQFGDYELIRPLGNGGMGHVYLGRHVKLDKPVAIKLVADHRRWDETSRRRFHAETRNLGRLNHPNIVTAFDAREIDGVAVLVTELIDGLNLSEILARLGPFSVPDAAATVAAICQGLTHCHELGLIHRDIKPSNVMIDAEGQVKLLDLGLARSSESLNVELTATGQALGTADYVAPELVDGRSEPDARSDVYSLGCTLFKLLAGQAPFASHETAFAKLNAHVSQVPESINEHRSDVPGPLVDLLQDMLAKKSADRPSSVAEVSQRLVEYGGDADLQGLVSRALATEVSPVGYAAAAQAAVKPKPEPAVAGGGRSWWWAVALGLAGFAFGLWLGITITVKKPDGTTAQVTIPDGSTATIDEDGNVEVTLGDSGERVTVPMEGGEKFSDERKGIQLDSNAPDALSGLYAAVTLDRTHVLFGGLRFGDTVDIYKGVGDSKTLLQRRAYVAGMDRSSDGVETIVAGPVLNRVLFYPKSELSIEKHDSNSNYNDLVTDLPPDASPNLINGEIVLRENDPLLGKLAKGDLVDVFMIEGKQATLVAFQRRVDAVTNRGDLESVRFEQKWNASPEAEFWIQFSKIKHLKNHRFETIVRGVWRPVLYKVGQDVVKDVAGQTVLVHQNKAVMVAADGFECLEFNTENGTVVNLKTGDNEEFDFRTLDNNRIDVTFGESTVRLQKITPDEAASKTEKDAFKILASASQAEVKFAMQIVDSADPPNELEGEALITNADLVAAKIEMESGRPNIGFTLSDAAGLRMQYYTERNIGKHLAVYIDGKLESSPQIQSAIGAKGVLVGDFTKERAEEIVAGIVPVLMLDGKPICTGEDSAPASTVDEPENAQPAPSGAE